MGIRRAIQSVVRTIARWTLDNPPGWISSGTGISDKLKINDVYKPAEKILWAYTSLRARAGSISQVPLRISDANDNIIEAGDLYDLLSRPNARMDTVQFVADIESYLTVYEECFTVPVAESGSLTDELVNLSPAAMSHITGVHQPTGSRAILGWRYLDKHTGQQRTFLNDEIIAMQSPNPHNPVRSISPRLWVCPQWGYMVPPTRKPPPPGERTSGLFTKISPAVPV